MKFPKIKKLSNESGLSKIHLLLLDTVFVIVIIITAWSILRIPALIQFTVVGYFAIIIQITAVLYIPLYLFLIRPHKIKNALIGTKNSTKKEPFKDRIIWTIGSIALLWVCYVVWYLLRDVIMVLHWEFLRGWSFDLFVFGVIVIFTATLKFSRKVMIGTVVGYGGGFALAVLFNTNTFDLNPSIYVNNAWIIWTVLYIIFIVLGIIWEIVSKYRKKMKA